MSNRDPIRALSDNVINQIAAGEVIERPASIVKELLENSLDAGATKIRIDLSDGGIESIRISDDGHGIPPDQLQLALSRHCTSKLVDAADLESISSLGFRGEALASISSVAEIAITSRTSDETHGWRVDMRPGMPAGKPRAQAHALGTTIEVRSLFATTPVRRRFLKQARTEFLHIQQFVRRAGFCYPEVAFALAHGLKQNLSLPAPLHASTIERRWRTLFGSEFIEQALPIDFPSPELQIRGWVGGVGYSRQNSDLQYIAVNRRIVRDRHIAHAVRMAYEANLEEGRHAAYALHLEMPTSAVDVNVHPGKAEVRFRDPRSVHDIVYAAVKQALGGIPSLVQAPSGYDPIKQQRDTDRVAEPRHPGRSFARPRPANPLPMPPLDADSKNLLSIAAHRFAFGDDKGTIFITDLHAAISRLVGARLERGERDSRPLIIPETMRAELSDEQIDSLAEFGIEIGRLGEGTIVLRAVPIVVREIDQSLFGASLISGVGSGKSEVAAIASAAAAGFQTPSGVVERRRWFALLANQLKEFELGLEDFSVVLDPKVLQGLFELQQD